MNPFEEIEALRDLEEDWDGENALPISTLTAELAKRLLTICDIPSSPVISPDPAGRIHLYWRLPNKSILLIVNGAQRDNIVCVTSWPDREPSRHVCNLRNIKAVISE